MGGLRGQEEVDRQAALRGVRDAIEVGAYVPKHQILNHISTRQGLVNLPGLFVNLPGFPAGVFTHVDQHWMRRG